MIQVGRSQNDLDKDTHKLYDTKKQIHLSLFSSIDPTYHNKIIILGILVLYYTIGLFYKITCTGPKI
jgi:hypothetical protein